MVTIKVKIVLILSGWEVRSGEWRGPCVWEGAQVGFCSSSYQSSVSFHDDSYKMALPYNNSLSCLFCALFYMLFYET